MSVTSTRRVPEGRPQVEVHRECVSLEGRGEAPQPVDGGRRAHRVRGELHPLLYKAPVT